MTPILDSFEAAIASNSDLPVLNAAQWAALPAEVVDLPDFDQQEALTFCRYKGRGFGVDLSS